MFSKTVSYIKEHMGKTRAKIASSLSSVLTLGRDIDDNHAWSARLEYYLQTGEASPSEAIGQLTQQDLFPDVEAWILQFNYSVKW